MAKERVIIDTIKNAGERKILKTELEKMRELKLQSDSISNRDKTGALDTLKITVKERMKKLGLDTKNLIHEGYSYYVMHGTNVSCSEENLRKAMMSYGLGPDVQEGIMLEAFKNTSYETVVCMMDKQGQ